jgi:hypothetical protein
LTRRLYLIKISPALCSLGYVDPKVVPHQNQLSILFIGICWSEGCTSSKSTRRCVHWDMLTRRLYLIKINSALCSLEYVYPKVVPLQDQSNSVFIGICWPEGCNSSKSAPHYVHLGYVDPKVVPHQNQLRIMFIWDMLTRRLYIIKISSALCSFGICWPEGCTSSKSIKHCVYWDMLTRRLYLIRIS